MNFTILRASRVESCIMLFRRLTSLMESIQRGVCPTAKVHYNPSCSLIDSRTSFSYSGRLSRYSFEQSTLAGDCRFGSERADQLPCRAWTKKCTSAPASIEITLRITFSTLCTGLHRSEACSYMVGSSPGVCNIEMQTFPSGYTTKDFNNTSQTRH